ncbi:MAG: glutamate--tRNA ligase [Chloroflexi bacterium]|nr:glutamate--tRNA ligase [Chloroflexota bacterium]
MPNQTVRVRFAPSPTGYFHLGSARTALYDFLVARHYNGRFILRIEDTDRTRYQPDAIPDLLEGLRWLGLWWDEGPEIGGDYGPYYQSDRLPIYQEYAEKLVREGKAYRCYCSEERLEALRAEQRAAGLPPGYDRHCRYLTQQEIAHYEAQGIRPVIRLAIPTEGVTEFDDLLRGHIVVENSQLDDFVLLKSDGFPTYHLAHVVDDRLMEISHVLRGDEWLPSAPRHVLLYRAFGWEMPVHVHLPVILDPSGKGKLSKRKKVLPDGREQFTYIHDFRRAGYLPEAMVNFLALVGWSYDGQTEFFSRDQLIRCFTLEGISKSPSALSYEKLEYMNAAYIRNLGVNDLAGRLLWVLTQQGFHADFDTVFRLTPLIRERIKTLNEAIQWVDFVFTDDFTYDPALLIPKGMDVSMTAAMLRAAIEALEPLGAFDEPTIETALRETGARLGVKTGAFLGALRVACTGKQVAPPLFGSLSIVGKERVLSRLRRALQALDGLAQ